MALSLHSRRDYQEEFSDPEAIIGCVDCFSLKQKIFLSVVGK